MDNKTYYMEVHKAKELYAIIVNNMNLIKKLVVNPALKNSILGDLNKAKQLLSLPNLKIQEEVKNAKL